MLTTRQRYLTSITDLWGGLDVSSFPQRMLLQKRLFFTVMLGVDLGYLYSWYIRGPYSPALTRDAFAIDKARKGGGITTGRLSSQLRKKVESIREVFSEDWDDPRRMELLASLNYLAKTHQTSDVTFLANRLSKLKGYFTENEAAAAFEDLKDRGLVDG